MQKSQKRLIKSSLTNVTDTIISNVYPLNIAWALAKSLYGNAIELRKERAQDFVEWLLAEMNIGERLVLNSEDFQDGFVLVLEKYIRERNFEKREAIKKIFLWFIEFDDKDSFDIEKHLQVLSLLSYEWLECLKLIETKLLPLHAKYIREIIIPHNITSYSSEEDAFNDLSRRFSPFDRLNELTNVDIYWAWLEDLIVLWIVRKDQSSLMWWDISTYHITDYGYIFLTYLNK